MSLLTRKKFLPLFLTQFLGAFNDNVLKNALIMLIVFKLGNEASVYTNIAAALFILPFFLFSSLAGQIAEHYEKAFLIKMTKIAEVVIMTLSAVAFYFDSVNSLIGLLFLIGVQSTFFGPLKYSILPQLLDKKEILSGNGLIEMGTFLAILIGTITGAYLVVKSNGELFVSLILVSTSLLGVLCSLFIQKTNVIKKHNQTINYNPITSTIDIFKLFKAEKKSVYLSVVAISWFWVVGSVYLTQLPQFVHSELGYSEQVITLFLVLFSLGIGTGSILCEKISKNYIEIGLVSFGILGMCLFGILLYGVTISFDSLTLIKNAQLLSFSDFFNDPRAVGLCSCLFFIGVFGGFYTVPLYTLIQVRAKKENLSRIIAANNILNALYMVISAVCCIVLLKFISITHLFLAMAILNFAVAVYICKQIPEFFIRFLTWFLLLFVYRLKNNNIHQIPEDKGALLVCNHVSFVDALLLTSEIKRPIRFIMYYKIYNLPVINFIARNLGAIPIAGIKEDYAVFTKAFETIKTALDNNELVCIFPEGSITYDGKMIAFKAGVERIIKNSAVEVIPVALVGVYGSMFSRKYKYRFPRKFMNKIVVEVGEPIQPEDVDRNLLYTKVQALIDKHK